MVRLVLLALALTACGAPAPSVAPEPATGSLSVTASVPRTPVTRTQNVLRVHVADALGASVAGASLEVEVTMPAHGHRAAAPTVVELDDGDYEAAPLNFTMAGTWEVTVAVKKEGRAGAATISVRAP